RSSRSNVKKYSSPSASKRVNKFIGSANTNTMAKSSNLSKISCVSPYAKDVKGFHGFSILSGGSVAAGGPYCEHFQPRKGVSDCSGHKKRHAEDFKLRGKKHCEKLRNGMTYVSTSFTECNCGVNDAGSFQCRIGYKHLCR
ncbi:MAG: hypothetical protein KC493_17795, partial [Bacteriovoracaceae bacterium]|nr:hypothetical protein [Bacteriovoracaceae bacterium]